MLYLWQETLLPHLSILVEYSCDVDCILILKWSGSGSVVSDSLQPHRLYSPWNSPGQYAGMGSCFLQVRTLRLRLSNLLTICVESYGSNINLMVLRPAFSSSLLNCGHDGGYSLLSALKEQRNISLGLIILFVKPRKKTNYFCLLQWENRNPIPYKCFLLKYKLVS